MRLWKKMLAALLMAAILASMLPTAVLAAGDAETGKKLSPGEVVYNLESMEVTVGTDTEKAEATFGTYALFDAQGNYTIQLEPDAFFPYEVQFTYGGNTWTEWFMDASDTVEVGGHIFSVESAVSDPAAVTGLQFEVGGETVIAWPAPKTFTNTGPAISLMSLLPLEEIELTVDLKGQTPPELAMPFNVRANSSYQIGDDVEILCKSQYDDNYQLLEDGTVYLPLNAWSNQVTLEMIIGTADQLDYTNKRYLVTVEYTPFADWLTVEVLDKDGQVIQGDVAGSYFDVYQLDGYGQNNAPDGRLGLPTRYDASYKLRLKLNQTKYPSPNFDQVVVNFLDIPGGYGGDEDLTAQFWGDNATGFPMVDIEYGTMILSLYSGGTLIGKLNVYTDITDTFDYTLCSPDGGYTAYGNRYYDGEVDAARFSILSTNQAEGQWAFRISSNGQYTAPEYIQKAVLGYFEDPNDPAIAGLPDIKEQLFSETGYAADYFGDEVAFTLIGETVSNELVADCFYVSAEIYQNTAPDNSLAVTFTGIDGVDADGVYAVKEEHDTYVVDGFQTLLTTENIDLSNLKLTFWTESGVTLYDSENQQQTGGVTTGHDFTNGPVRFTAVSGDAAGKNFWVTVEKKQTGGALFINGYNDPENPPDETAGYPIYERQAFLDSYYGYEHDIFLANLGDTALTDLRVVLEQDTSQSGTAPLELDSYWRINDGASLAEFTSAAIGTDTPHGEISNAAKLRLRFAGSSGELDSMLKIYSGETILAAIHITGVAGDPSIITTDIPQAVQYVPYGAVIQNTNRYDWNQVSYSLLEGELPEGMELRPNGELYGVPTETGTFEFIVEMDNSYNYFPNSQMPFTLVVNEPTDMAVEGQNDPGYGILERVPDIMTAYTDQIFVSEGEFNTFMDFWLDGKKLVEGTDYDAEEGSTRITIRAQTFQNAGSGTHTIAAEFRTDGVENSANSTLRRTAQNYTIGSSSTGGNTGSGGSSSNSSSSSSSSSSSASYDIEVKQADGGTITVNKSSASRGSTMTITVTPDDGYELDELIVTDRNGNRIVVSEAGSNQYTFTMPSSKVSIQAVFVAIPEPEPVPGLPFTDVGIHDWFAPYVTDVYERGLMEGTSATTFEPNTTTSRGMMVKILYSLAGSPAVDGTYFSDVPLNQFYTEAMAWAAENGIVDGYGDGRFGPVDPITREQMVMILMNYAAYEGIDVSQQADLELFSDSGKISPYAVEAMAWACAEGVLNGKGNGILDPQGQATRAEVAAIFSRFCLFLEDDEDDEQ